MPEIIIRWQRFEQFSPVALYQILRFRQNIFVVEQSSPYADLDGLDQHAWHSLLWVEGELAGYLRLLHGPLRIGRVAVAKPLRHRGLGNRLMGEALRFCHERFPSQQIVLAAQLDLVTFYRRFGFVATSEPYDDFGVLHVEMRRDPEA